MADSTDLYARQRSMDALQSQMDACCDPGCCGGMTGLEPLMDCAPDLYREDAPKPKDPPK